MNKIKFTLLILFGAIFIILAQSCTDHFDELNTDPRLVDNESVDPGLLFTRSVHNGVYDIVNSPGGNIVKEYSGIHVSQSSGNIFNNRNYANPFQGMYVNELITIAEMIRLTEGEEWYANYNAIGRIWKVWLFQQVTDAYGDIPYFDAVKAQDESVTNPSYDTQEEIYRDMLEQLKQAAADLQDSEQRGSLGEQDLLYGGDVELWRRFANSLRLRYALRVRFADEQLAAEHISDVINAPLIADNSQNAFVMTLPENTPNTDNRHPLFNDNINTLNPFACTHTVISNMRADISEDLDMNDPRLSVFCDPASTDGEYRGNVINRDEGYRWFHTNQNISHLDERFLQAEQPINLLTYAEVQFNIAEARLAGLASGDPQSAYQDGIRASLELYEVDEADISAFLTSSAGTLSGTAEDQLRHISTQRYLSFFQQTMEAWNEWRRTGYPIIYVSFTHEGHTGGEVPRRLTYPESEHSANGEKLQEAISRLGADELMSRIWWDAKPGLPYTHPHDGLFPPPPDEDVTEDDFD